MMVRHVGIGETGGRQGLGDLHDIAPGGNLHRQVVAPEASIDVCPQTYVCGVAGQVAHVLRLGDHIGQSGAAAALGGRNEEFIVEVDPDHTVLLHQRESSHRTDAGRWG